MRKRMPLQLMHRWGNRQRIKRPNFAPKKCNPRSRNIAMRLSDANQYAQQQQGYAGGMQQAAGGINQFNEQQAGLQGQQNALNQQGALAYQQLGFNAQAEQLQAMESNQQAANSLNQSNAKNMSSGMGGILGAVGGAAFLSDKRSKTNIKMLVMKLMMLSLKWARMLMNINMTQVLDT